LTEVRPVRSGDVHSSLLGIDNCRSALLATGADTRGAIYAAYTLSEEVLGVDPWYYWVDKEQARRDHIEVAATLDEHFGPPPFKYRGWFMNDEDLLSGFAPDLVRENVYSLEMYDHIYETMLRRRANMVAPATFPFPELVLWQAVRGRGIGAGPCAARAGSPARRAGPAAPRQAAATRIFTNTRYRSKRTSPCFTRPSNNRITTSMERLFRFPRRDEYLPLAFSTADFAASSPSTFSR
jgi:hypothetical protein